MRQTFSDFVNFIRTQGVVGFAVGFILGKAISDLVASLVNDIINPIIGLIIGRLDLANMSIKILSASINYGKFISICINFVIIAAVVYFGVKKLDLDKLFDKPKE